MSSYWELGFSVKLTDSASNCGGEIGTKPGTIIFKMTCERNSERDHICLIIEKKKKKGILKLGKISLAIISVKQRRNNSFEAGGV